MQVWQAIEKVLQEDRIEDEDGLEDNRGKREDERGGGGGEGEGDDVIELTPLAPLHAHTRQSFCKVCIGLTISPGCSKLQQST